MKFLVFDHFFEQDIEAFRTAAKGHQLLVFQASILQGIARKYLPAFAFSSFDPQEFAQDEYVKAYQCYEEKAREILHDLYMIFPFDAFISPSDIYPYVRPWVKQTHELGLPFIVMQKETTVMPLFMNENASAIGRVFPFIGDLMLVCSERLKQFWLNAGADAQKIIVTGQPRFDFYRRNAQQRAYSKPELQEPAGRPTILFLSYDVDITYAIGSDTQPTWLQLRSETEEVLINLARKGCFNVLIKPHPQQQGIPGYKKKMRKLSGSHWGDTVHFVEELKDVRQLIMGADIVIGFQTTGLIEAMAAGKKIVYTFWTDSAERFAVDLLPFHKMGDILGIAHSPQELEDLLLEDYNSFFNEEQVNRRLKFAEEHLGPLDGHAAERCLKLIEKCVFDYAKQIEPNSIILRNKLGEQSPAYCRRALLRARIACFYWGGASLILPALYPIWLSVRWLMGRRGNTSLTFMRRKFFKCYRSNVDRSISCRATLKELRNCKPKNKGID